MTVGMTVVTVAFITSVIPLSRRTVETTSHGQAIDEERPRRRRDHVRRDQEGRRVQYHNPAAFGRLDGSGRRSHRSQAQGRGRWCVVIALGAVRPTLNRARRDPALAAARAGPRLFFSPQPVGRQPRHCRDRAGSPIPGDGSRPAEGSQRRPHAGALPLLPHEMHGATHLSSLQPRTWIKSVAHRRGKETYSFKRKNDGGSAGRDRPRSIRTVPWNIKIFSRDSDVQFGSLIQLAVFLHDGWLSRGDGQQTGRTSSINSSRIRR